MNTNPKAKRILCFGDSLTWGYVPGTDHDRYPADTRWTGRLQALLGDDFEVIEEGLNSRGIATGDSRVGKEGRVGMDYIRPCLDTHVPLDAVIVLLGTNELKAEKNQTPKEIAKQLETFIGAVKDRLEKNTRIVIISPPLVNEDTQYSKKDNKYVGASEKSRHMSGEYKNVAKKLGVEFLDFATLETGIDGVHLTDNGHKDASEIAFNKIKGFYV